MRYVMQHNETEALASSTKHTSTLLGGWCSKGSSGLLATVDELASHFESQFIHPAIIAAAAHTERR